MSDEPIKIILKPGERAHAKSGQSYILIVPVDRAVIDGHSHIQSGATCPLPLLWAQAAVADVLRPGRSFLDFTAPLIFGHGGRVQRLKTEEIADALVGDLQAAYGEACLLRKDAKYPDGLEFFTPVIIMPMDMDYAHIAGFPPWSTTIYHEGKFEKLLPPSGPYAQPPRITVDGVYYYDRKDALAAEAAGVLVDVSGERPNRVWVYQRFKAQMDATLAAIKKYPWLLIPMFHYDPRRWCNLSGGEFDDKKWVHGPWDEPFKYIATLLRAGIFIGFKMYPPLGYKPLDTRLPLLDKFYAKCKDDSIPILTHCSPGGMTTHEADFYYRFDRKDLKSQPKVDAVAGGSKRMISYDPATPAGYFFDEYVHPKNWRPVLKKYPELKLCLAHFGGREWDESEGGTGLASDWVQEIVRLTAEFPNVYTDMSCFDLKNESVRKNVCQLFREMRDSKRYRHLQDKLIFGVDWYLSLITGAPEYKEYVESFYTTIGEIDKQQWNRISLVNPAAFYGLDNHKLLSNMNKALEDNLADKGKRTAGFERIKGIKTQIEAIRNRQSEQMAK